MQMNNKTSNGNGTAGRTMRPTRLPVASESAEVHKDTASSVPTSVTQIL